MELQLYAVKIRMRIELFTHNYRIRHIPNLF